MITVFTPTYNRAHTLGKVFESLKRQTYKDFEWLIIDDGSTDSTKDTVEGFKKERAGFDIEYLYEQNGGKHTAMNAAGDMARGELLVICDSDDWLMDDALEKIMSRYADVKDDGKIAGIIGRCTVENREKFFKDKQSDFDFKDLPYHLKEKRGIYGESTFAFKTDIFKKYKFPEIKGERYLPESVQLNMMAMDGYVFRFVSEILKRGVYLEDGLTYDYTKINHDNPKGYALWRIQEAKLCADTVSNLARVYNDYRVEMIYRYSEKEIARFLKIPYIYLKMIKLFYKLKKKKSKK